MTSAEVRAGTEKLGYRPALDGLRGIAILLVLAKHWNVGRHGGGGWIGVDLFFVLSGFLITCLLLEEAAAGRVNLPAFYVRRARRLFPALAVFLAACVGWAVLVADEAMRRATLTGAATAAGYVSNFVAVDDHPVDLTSHTWSLAVEEHFYLLWPIVLILVHRRAGATGVLRAAVVGAGLALAMRLYGVAEGVGNAYNHTNMRADALLIGCALAAWVSLHGFPKVRLLGWLGAAWFTWVMVAQIDNGAWFMPRWGYTVNALAAAAVVAWVVQMRRGPIVNPVLIKIGALSYGIYLWHGAINKATGPYLNGTPHWPHVIVLAALTFTACTLSYELVERRFRSGRLDQAKADEPSIVPEGVPSIAGDPAHPHREQLAC